jgi:hypothetical protein
MTVYMRYVVTESAFDGWDDEKLLANWKFLTELTDNLEMYSGHKEQELIDCVQ